MGDALDNELLGILNKLTKIQKEIGGGKTKDDNLASRRGVVLDRFIDLKHTIAERLEVVKTAIDEVRKLEKVPGSDPKMLIGAQSKVRNELAQVNDEWRELDTIFRLEAKKRRSKYSPEELKERQEMLMLLQTQIMEIKEMQRAGYVKGYKANRLSTMEESEMFKPRNLDAVPGGPGGAGSSSSNGIAGVNPNRRGVTGQRNNNMTDQHQMQLMQLKERDQLIDQEIDLIGQGVDELRELAMVANEEVKLQNRMLDGLEAKMDHVGEKVINVNAQLKKTLDEARKSDKICMDIICVIILVGMIIVVYKVSSDNQKKEENSS